MKIFKSRTTKAVALALAAVLQVYASGGFALAAAPKGTAVVAPSALRQVQGRLTTTGDNPVSVNGNSARTGETIFSGQQIQTPAGTTATVQLPGLGSVEVRPGSNVTLSFGDGKIDVVVTSGCVRLTADSGVTGTVQAGARTRTTTSNDRTIEICSDAAGAAVPVGSGGTAGAGTGAGAGATTGGGLGTGTALALTAAAVGAFSIISHELISDSENPEPTTCTPIPGTTSPLTPPSGCTP